MSIIRGNGGVVYLMARESTIEPMETNTLVHSKTVSNMAREKSSMETEIFIEESTSTASLKATVSIYGQIAVHIAEISSKASVQATESGRPAITGWKDTRATTLQIRSKAMEFTLGTMVGPIEAISTTI